METELTNVTRAVGVYNGIPTSITSTASVVTMVEGLSITKTADKQIWADGNLTYTIVISNETENVYERPTITDVLDNTLIKFVEGSITIDGNPATSSEYVYLDDTHTLTVTLSNIDPSATKTITFEVSKI